MASTNEVAAAKSIYAANHKTAYAELLQCGRTAQKRPVSSTPGNDTLMSGDGKRTKRCPYVREREEAMIDALEDAFKEVAQLPEDEQQHIVEIIRQEIASEHRWQIFFHDPRSERVLEKLVNEALEEDVAGKTEEITGEDFLS